MTNHRNSVEFDPLTANDTPHERGFDVLHFLLCDVLPNINNKVYTRDLNDLSNTVRQ